MTEFVFLDEICQYSLGSRLAGFLLIKLSKFRIRIKCGTLGLVLNLWQYLNSMLGFAQQTARHGYKIVLHNLGWCKYTARNLFVVRSQIELKERDREEREWL